MLRWVGCIRLVVPWGVDCELTGQSLHLLAGGQPVVTREDATRDPDSKNFENHECGYEQKYIQSHLGRSLTAGHCCLL